MSQNQLSNLFASLSSIDSFSASVTQNCPRFAACFHRFQPAFQAFCVHWPRRPTQHHTTASGPWHHHSSHLMELFGASKGQGKPLNPQHGPHRINVEAAHISAVVATPSRHNFSSKLTARAHMICAWRSLNGIFIHTKTAFLITLLAAFFFLPEKAPKIAKKKCL